MTALGATAANQWAVVTWRPRHDPILPQPAPLHFAFSPMNGGSFLVTQAQELQAFSNSLSLLLLHLNSCKVLKPPSLHCQSPSAAPPTNTTSLSGHRSCPLPDLPLSCSPLLSCVRWLSQCGLLSQRCLLLLPGIALQKEENARSIGVTPVSHTCFP